MSPEFGRRHANEPARSNVHIYQNYGPFIDCIKGPLSSRGWTLQERELSPRILHYTKDQVLWECRECTASEASPKLEPKSPKQLGGESGTHSFDSSLPASERLVIVKQTAGILSWRLLDQTSGERVEAVMRKWYALVEGYSRRQLTVKRDKLPAISGMAAEVARMNGRAPYAAGLWTNDMVRGLSWFPDPVLRRVAKRGEWPPHQPDDGIPSWSWAAFDGSITYYGEDFQAYHGRRAVRPPQQLHLETTPASRDPFGRVSGGVIGLSGWAVEASVSETLYDPDFRGVTFRAKCYRLPASFRYPPTLRMYFDADAEDLPQISIVCLRLGNGLSPRQTYGDVGLVLMRMSDGNKFRRVGMFDVEAVDQIWVSVRVETTVDIV